MMDLLWIGRDLSMRESKIQMGLNEGEKKGRLTDGVFNSRDSSKNIWKGKNNK